MEAEVKNEIKSVFDETVKAYADKVEELEHKVKTLEEKPIVAPMFSSVGKTYKGYRLENQLTQLKEKGFSEEKADFVSKCMIEVIEARKAGKSIGMKAAAAHIEGVDAQGGFAVLEDYFNQIEKGARNLSIIGSLANNFSTTSDTFNVRKTDTEFQVAIDGEGTISQGSATLGNVAIPVKKISVYGAVSNELLEDANYDIVSWITEQITYSAGQTLDYQAFNGTGTGAGKMCSGVLTAIVTNSVVLSGANLSSITADNLSLAMTKLAQLDRVNGTFVLGAMGMHYIRTLKDTLGNPIYQAISGSDLNKIWGKPSVECAQIDDLASVTDTAYGVFGDFKKFFIVNRTTGMDLLIDPYSDSVSDNTRLIYRTRLGMGVARGTAFCRILTA